MLINESFVSYQGEGRYSGKKTLFVRLQGCNFRCVWCDTPDALSKDGGSEVVNDELVKRINKTEVNNIVFTGGEPLLQYKDLLCVIRKIASEIKYENPTIEIETNGTIHPKDLIFQTVHFNVSPKLDHSGMKRSSVFNELIVEYEKSTIRPDYKFVVDLNSNKPLAEVFNFYYDFDIPPDRIWLMPLGTVNYEIIGNVAKLMRMDHPFNVSSRNHIIYGVK
jgi:organic radical activating enzyme